MQKLFLAILSLFLLVGTVEAQEGSKALKKAGKSLGNYNQNPKENADKLAEALELIEIAFQSEEVTSNPESYVKKAEIYNEIANAEIKQKLLNDTYELLTPRAALIAYEAINKAMKMATKGHHTKDALSALIETENHLNNVAITQFQVQNYDDAFMNFKAGMGAYETLTANEKKSRLDDEIIRKEHYFYTAVSGYYGNMKNESKPVFMKLYKSGSAEPLVYEALFSLSSENEEEALKYLEEGRAKFPEDTGLLFAEINHYLTEGKLDILTGKLKVAIEKEPENVSVYITLGNVYDQLNQQQREAGDLVKADEYFDLAYDYYNQGLERDSTKANHEAYYSLGALYYNKAATYTDKINELANDFSKAGTQKYNVAKGEMDLYFEKAMPYFEKAESLKPTDLNTLIALKEIYARKDLLQKSNEMKVRIEALKDGGGE